MVRVTLNLKEKQKKNMIRKTSLPRHESPCLPLKTFKLLNKREERSNNIRKTVLIAGMFNSFLNISRDF